MKFSQLDNTEKDDSTEKENVDKDEVLDNTSPLDMDNKKLETKLNLEDKGEELDEESTRDSRPLLENESNQVNIKEDKPVEIDHGTEARRRKKGKGLRAFQNRRVKEGGETEISSPLLARVACLAREIFCPFIFLVVRKLLEGLREAARGGHDLIFQFRGRRFSVFNWLSSFSINEVDLFIIFVRVWVRRTVPVRSKLGLISLRELLPLKHLVLPAYAAGLCRKEKGCFSSNLACA